MTIKMSTKTVLVVVVVITTAAMLSMMAGQVSTQVVYAAKEKCTTFQFDTGETNTFCTKQGKDPTSSNEFCHPDFGCVGSEGEVTHRGAAEQKTNNEQFCRQVVNDNDEDGVTCSIE
jgi:hypothetical protein